jgi:hypothetical protein
MCKKMVADIDEMISQLVHMRARIEDIEGTLGIITESKAGVSTPVPDNGQDAINTRILTKIHKTIARRNNR